MKKEADLNIGKENVNMPASTFSSYVDTLKAFLVDQMLLASSMQQPLSIHYLYSHIAFLQTIHTASASSIADKDFDFQAHASETPIKKKKLWKKKSGKKEEITCFLENKDNKKI